MRTSHNLSWMFALVVVSAMLLGSLAHADVTLPSVIGDHMVLQTGIVTPIWGTAEPGEAVAVQLGEQQASTAANAAGKWSVKLGPFEPGGPVEMTVTASNVLTVQDILIGEVWVCSGQSNMQWAVRNSWHPETEIAEANYPQMRLFTVKHVTSDKPLEDTNASWDLCTPETVPGFSAVGYFFGKELHKTRNVPVGLINTSWGGTPAESWTSLPTLEGDPVLEPILRRWDVRLQNYPIEHQKYRERLAEWQTIADEAEALGRPVPRRPGAPVGPDHPHRPASLYNGMIAPLIPYAIRGAIWYQGESNAGRAYEYRKLFPKMISDWRAAWNQGQFPFLFVQLANFNAWGSPPPNESAWAELREAQTMTLMLPNTGMAVTTDIGESYDIHPRNKQEVGRRLALSAQGIAYGEDIVHSGPLYDSFAVEERRIRLRFKHLGSGLEASDGQALRGFMVAGPDCQFVGAQAKIEEDTVVVWNNWVAHPIAVRYAWAHDPTGNLCNAEGLPASSFRTDRWPGVTAEQPDLPAPKNPQVEATYKLSPETVGAVTDAWNQLLRMAQTEDMGEVSPSLIVDKALQMALQQLQAEGSASELVKQLQAK